jgi:hypothetical protein
MIRVEVNDLMQHDYIYHLTEPIGQHFVRTSGPN